MKRSKIWGLAFVLAAVGVLVFLFPFEESKETSRSHAAYYSAEESLESGDLATAHAQALELLKVAQGWKGHWNYGNAIHDGHTVLGKIAFKRGNLQEAKLELLLAGDTPGSPQLNSFGPRTDLVEELLRAGERQAVLAYFDKCAKFWELGQADLTNWRAEVKAGKIPDFENSPRLWSDFGQTMRIFLTGGTGYLGAHIVRTLLTAGHQLTILSRNQLRIASLEGHPAIRFLVGNLEDSVDLHGILAGHDALIHNAIIWDEEPTELEMKDVRAAAKLFECAAKSGVRHTIYTSSVAVHRPFQVRMDEKSHLQPADYYGATKAANESFLWAVANQFGMRANVLRLGPLVGGPAYPDAPFKTDRRFTEIATAALRNEPVDVQKEISRQFLGVVDAATIFRSVLESEIDRQVLLCLAPEILTWEDIARRIIEESGSLSRLIAEGRSIAPRFEFDVNKLSDLLGLIFCSRDVIDEHIRFVIQQFRDRHAN